jgi:CRISPR-associated endonuclease/helicase Cas3
MENYSSFFVGLTGHGQPHGWQEDLAMQQIGNRLIRIPTGFGKTQGVLASWLWNRIVQRDDRWPRRLVWCLPMRLLVEQHRRRDFVFSSLSR